MMGSRVINSMGSDLRFALISEGGGGGREGEGGALRVRNRMVR